MVLKDLGRVSHFLLCWIVCHVVPGLHSEGSGNTGFPGGPHAWTPGPRRVCCACVFAFPKQRNKLLQEP